MPRRLRRPICCCRIRHRDAREGSANERRSSTIAWPVLAADPGRLALDCTLTLAGQCELLGRKLQRRQRSVANAQSFVADPPGHAGGWDCNLDLRFRCRDSAVARRLGIDRRHRGDACAHSRCGLLGDVVLQVRLSSGKSAVPSSRLLLGIGIRYGWRAAPAEAYSLGRLSMGSGGLWDCCSGCGGVSVSGRVSRSRLARKRRQVRRTRISLGCATHATSQLSPLR